MAIRCCAKCVAPKRHVGCHITCPEYIEQKARHEEEAELIRKQKFEEANFFRDRRRAVLRAAKEKRVK